MSDFTQEFLLGFLPGFLLSFLHEFMQFVFFLRIPVAVKPGGFYHASTMNITRDLFFRDFFRIFRWDSSEISDRLHQEVLLRFLTKLLLGNFSAILRRFLIAINGEITTENTPETQASIPGGLLVQTSDDILR